MPQILTKQDLERLVNVVNSMCARCDKDAWLPTLRGEPFSYCEPCAMDLMDEQDGDNPKLQLEKEKLQRIYNIARFKVN